jgi:hypothetical protein
VEALVAPFVTGLGAGAEETVVWAGVGTRLANPGRASLCTVAEETIVAIPVVQAPYTGIGCLIAHTWRCTRINAGHALVGRFVAGFGAGAEEAVVWAGVAGLLALIGRFVAGLDPVTVLTVIRTRISGAHALVGRFVAGFGAGAEETVVWAWVGPAHTLGGLQVAGLSAVAVQTIVAVCVVPAAHAAIRFVDAHEWRNTIFYHAMAALIGPMDIAVHTLLLVNTFGVGSFIQFFEIREPVIIHVQTITLALTFGDIILTVESYRTGWVLRDIYPCCQLSNFYFIAVVQPVPNDRTELVVSHRDAF